MGEPSEEQPSSPAYTWFFLAMAHHALGHQAEAREWLDKATAWTDLALAQADEGLDYPRWNRRFTWKLLRAEAEALLTTPSTPPTGTEETEKAEE